MSTSRDKRRTYHHGDLRASLLAAAGDLLEKQGPARIVLRDVARRAGVSHNAPYRHFESREALLAALAAAGFDDFSRRMAAAGPGEMGQTYVAFALERPQLFRLMFGGVLRLSADAELARAARRAYDGLVGAFRSRRDIADPETAAAAAWSLVHGLAQLILDGHFAEGVARDGSTGFARRVLSVVRFAAAPAK